MPYAKILTANALAHGGVVFLTPDGDWSGDIARAAIAETDRQSDALIEIANASGNRTQVVEPYAIDAAICDGRPSPVRLRERIRAAGPTVRGDLRKPALHVSGGADARGVNDVPL